MILIMGIPPATAASNFIEKKFDTKIIGCKTIRNRNNLALSSRNFLFTKKELNQVEKISNKSNLP